MITLYVKLGDEDICAAFQELGPGRKIQQVMMFRKGQDVLCDVTGWRSDAEASTIPAVAQRITDSGDAVATLIHGGDLGILLKPSDIEEPWNPESPHQEQRAYLVVSNESEIIYA